MKTAAAPRKALTHKERLLTSGARLLYARGFQGATVDAVLDDAGVSKGTFYHHFGSKEAFGAAVLDRYVADQEALLRRWAERDDLSVPARLAAYHNQLRAGFVASRWRKPCLAGKLSNELAASSDGFRHQLAAAFDTWDRMLTTLLTQGQQRGEVRTDLTADHLSRAVLAMIQGAFVAALSLRDPAYLRSVTDGIVDLVEVR